MTFLDEIIIDTPVYFTLALNHLKYCFHTLTSGGKSNYAMSTAQQACRSAFLVFGVNLFQVLNQYWQFIHFPDFFL